MTGISNPWANPLEKQTQVNKVPANPGPCVTAIPSMFCKETPASTIALQTRKFSKRSCSLEANSGTTPP